VVEAPRRDGKGPHEVYVHMCEAAARNWNGLRRGGRLRCNLAAVAALALPAPGGDVCSHAFPAEPGRDEAASGPGTRMGDGVDAVEDISAVVLWNNRPDETPGNITEDMACGIRDSMKMKAGSLQRVRRWTGPLCDGHCCQIDRTAGGRCDRRHGGSWIW
jgi:hypothetical protein